MDQDACLVKIPRALSRQVIAEMRRDYLRPDRPERMPVRFSHVRFRPAPYQVHADFTVSAGGFCCFIHDLDGRRRPANRDDVLSAINMVNHLEQIDYTGLPVSDQSVPAEHRPVVMAAELAKWTRKIGGIETVTQGGRPLDSRNRPGGGRLGRRVSPTSGPGRLCGDPLAAVFRPEHGRRSFWSTSSSACPRRSTPCRQAARRRR